MACGQKSDPRAGTPVPVSESPETGAARELPNYRSLMHECAQAAKQSGNDEIIELTDQVLEMLGLWEEYLQFRRDMISQADGGIGGQ